MLGLEAVHALQRERGRTGLRLSMGLEAASNLHEARRDTDEAILAEFVSCIDESALCGYEESLALVAELKYIPAWLNRDRAVVEKLASELTEVDGARGWTQRAALVEKFNGRIEVLIGACMRSLSEILDTTPASTERDDAFPNGLSKLLVQWCEGKEALGRLRAFVSAGGPKSASIVKSSLMMRQCLHETIEHKESRIARVLSLHVDLTPGTRWAAPDALYHMLEKVTVWEWALMGCFSASTPLSRVHSLLSADGHTECVNCFENGSFDVEKFFGTTSAAIDLMLSIVKALAASACADA